MVLGENLSPVVIDRSCTVPAGIGLAVGLGVRRGTGRCVGLRVPAAGVDEGPVDGAPAVGLGVAEATTEGVADAAALLVRVDAGEDVVPASAVGVDGPAVSTGWLPEQAETATSAAAARWVLRGRVTSAPS
jgi:hypothetical protein